MTDASNTPDNAWRLTPAPYEEQDDPWSSIEDYDRERDDRLTDEAYDR